MGCTERGQGVREGVVWWRISDSSVVPRCGIFIGVFVCCMYSSVHLPHERDCYAEDRREERETLLTCTDHRQKHTNEELSGGRPRHIVSTYHGVETR